MRSAAWRASGWWSAWRRSEALERTACHAVRRLARRSLLATREIEAATHKGVLIAFALNFVKPGTVSSAGAKILSELQAVRERADYQVELSYDAADVARHFRTARPLFDELAGLLAAVKGLRSAGFAAAWREVVEECGAPKRTRRKPSRPIRRRTPHR